MKKYLNVICMLTAALVIGALSAVLSQMGPFLHMSAKASYNENAAVKTVLMTGTGKCTIIMNDEDPETSGRYIYKLSAAVYLKEDKAADLLVTVYTDDGSSTEKYRISDKNPVYVRNEIIKIDRENVVSVDIETADKSAFSVSDIKVLNNFTFNYIVFICAALSANAILFCAGLFFKKDRGDAAADVRKAFVTAAACFGVCLCICLPANKVGYDEETHLQAVMQTASFPSNELHISDGLMNQLIVTEFNNPEAQPGTFEEIQEFEKALSRNVNYKEGDRAPQFHVMANRVPAYLAMAIAAKAGKGLSLPWPVILRLMRLSNLAVHIMLIWLSLKVLPCGHLLMAVIGLLPQNLFMAATVSYDPFVTGCLMVGFAFLLKNLLGKEEALKILVRDTALMLFFMFLGCLPKAVYAPLMLTALAVPFRRLKDRQQKTVYMCAVISVFVFTMLLFVIPTVVAPADAGDTRGAADVSEMSQMSFILSDPFGFVRILLSQMIRWIPQCLIGPDCTTFMGHLVTGSTAFKGYWPIYFLLFVLSSAGCRENIQIKAKERLWTVFMCFGAGVLVWSAMYVSFTSPGASEIAGVQGRYFIPLLFPVYLSLFGGVLFSAGTESDEGKTAVLVRNERIWYDLTIAALVVLMTLSVWRAVILPYCM